MNFAKPADGGVLPVASGISVVVVTPITEQLPQLAPFGPRWVLDESGVRASDDVVVLLGTGMADVIQRLRFEHGHRPGVLVVAPELDPDDVISALSAGTTGYVVAATSAPWLPDAVRHTARGESWISPEAASVLIHRIRWEPAEEQVEGGATGSLSPRECQIMNLLARGLTVVEIARALSVREKTVRNNLSNVFRKLKVRRQAEAVLRWVGRSHPSEACAVLPSQQETWSPQPQVERTAA